MREPFSIDRLPANFKNWPDFARDRYEECILSARQDMPEDMPLHFSLVNNCKRLAETEMELARQAAFGKAA